MSPSFLKSTKSGIRAMMIGNIWTMSRTREYAVTGFVLYLDRA